MKTILITGHMGLTGRAAAELFHKKGWQVVGIDNNSRAHFFSTDNQEAPDFCVNYFIDIREEDFVEDIFRNHQFDAIVHTAAQPSHDYSTDHVIEDFDINARASLILLENTRKYCPNVPFVFCSTDKVYGERMHTDYLDAVQRMEGFDEHTGLDFAGDRSLFGCSKAAADMYVQEYGAKFGMKTACFRLGCITGKNHQGAPQHGFLSYLAKCIKEEIPYHVHGDGKQVRDQIHANDLATVFYAFIEDPKVGAVYNMGGGPERALSLLEAVEEIEECTGKKAKLIFGEPNRKGDRLWDVHDISKFRKDYPDWDYQYDLSDIIEDICS